MLERYSIIGAAFSITVILLDFYLLKKRKIQGKGFVFWFVVGVVLGLFSTVPFLFSLLTWIYGTEAVASAVAGTGFLFFLIVFLYLHSRISELQSQITKLAMEISVAKYTREQSKRSNTKRRTIRKRKTNESET